MSAEIKLSIRGNWAGVARSVLTVVGRTLSSGEVASPTVTVTVTVTHRSRRSCNRTVPKFHWDSTEILTSGGMKYVRRLEVEASRT